MISIVICTYNRRRLLPRAIESVIAQDFSFPYELIIVDNASTDGTPDLIEKWRKQYPSLILYVFEPVAGLSHARNAGVAAASGEIIAMIDDDAFADTDWLREIQSAFDEFPQAGCVGGHVIPEWESRQPAWINDELLPAIGGENFGTEKRILDGKLYPVGANMAFRKSVFYEVEGFNPILGRIGNKLLSCEEVDFAEKIRKGGWKITFRGSDKSFVYLGRLYKTLGFLQQVLLIYLSLRPNKYLRTSYPSLQQLL
jgi:glycosyltransferase involved in cell wall biosynthesis